MFLPVVDEGSGEAVDFVEIEGSVLGNSYEEILEGWWRSGVLECERCVEDGPAWTKVPRSFELFWFEDPEIGEKRDSIARLAESLLKGVPREGRGEKAGWRRLKAQSTQAHSKVGGVSGDSRD